MSNIKLLWYLLVWLIGHCGGDEHNYVRPIWTNLVQIEIYDIFQSSLSLSTTFLKRQFQQIQPFYWKMLQWFTESAQKSADSVRTQSLHINFD